MRMNKSGFRPGILAAAALGLFAIAATSAQARMPKRARRSLKSAPAATTISGRSVGPSLLGVYGRQSGSLEGYKYSPAMKRSKLTWDDKNLHDYIADPQRKVKANNMSFKGIRSSADIDDLVEYLKTYK